MSSSHTHDSHVRLLQVKREKMSQGGIEVKGKFTPQS